MMRKTFFILILIFLSVTAISQSISKDSMILVVMKDTHMTSKVAQKIRELGSYSYLVRPFKKVQEGFSTEWTEKVFDNLNFIGDVYLYLDYDDLSKKMSAWGTFKDSSFYLEKDTLETDDWAYRFSVEILEYIASQRLVKDGTWKLLQLTFYKGVDEYPYFQDNVLYYISDRYIGNRELYIWNMNANIKEKIPLEQSSEYFPDITPDKKFIAFQSSMFGKWDVVLYETDNKSIKRISTSSYKNAYSPYCYSDTLILFSQDETDRSSEIWMYDTVEATSHRLTYVDNMLKFLPAKYDSNKIIFSGTNLITGDTGIYVINEDKTVSPLIDTQVNETDCWSDSSEYIVYSKLIEGRYKIFLYNDGQSSIKTPSIDDDCYYPTFDKDRNFIFFTVYYKDKEPDIFAVRF